MPGVHLAVDQVQPMPVQMSGQVRQRNFGGVWRAREHGFTIDHPPHVHGIQAAMLTLIANGIMPLKWQHYVSVLLFGFFTMLDLRKALFQAAERKVAEKRNPPSTPE